MDLSLHGLFLRNKKILILNKKLEKKMLDDVGVTYRYIIQIL